MRQIPMTTLSRATVNFQPEKKQTNIHGNKTSSNFYLILSALKMKRNENIKKEKHNGGLHVQNMSTVPGILQAPVFLL